MVRDDTDVAPGTVSPPDEPFAVNGLPLETWLDVLLSDIHEAVEAILPEMENAGAAARQRLENILGYTPPPELLANLRRVAAAPENSALRMGLGRMLVALAILVHREVFALTEPRQVEPGMLQRQARTLPALAGRVQYLEEDIRSLQTAERDRLRRLRVTLIPPLPRLHGLTILAERLDELTLAAREGRLSPETGLSPAEIAWFQAAVGRARQEKDLVPRALLDAVALRVGLREDLKAHYGGTSSRSRLEACAAAYELATERLQTAEKDAREAGQPALARRFLFAGLDLARLDRKLGAILRGGRERTRPSTGPAFRSLFQYQTPAWIAAGAVLVVVVGLALLAPSRSGAASGLNPGSDPGVNASSGSARPPAPVEVEFTRIDRQGESLVAEITSWNWSRMPEEQRREEVYGLGVMAFSQEAREVWIVDETGRELAKWSRGGTLTLLDSRP